MIDVIDTTFDFRVDTPPGADPDSRRPTLRRYHQLLWNKPLPSGEMLTLSTSVPRRYLSHTSERGDFNFTSDAVMQSFTRWTRMQPIIAQVPEHENEQFRTIGYTIGGMMIWPGQRRPGSNGINSARGTNHRIADRMDLTLECVRLYYLGQDSPLFKTFAVYHDFFDLFETFEGFVDFFLLQDLTDGHGKVMQFLPLNDFTTRGWPTDLSSYLDFRARSIEFIVARNERISRAAVSS